MAVSTIRIVKQGTHTIDPWESISPRSIALKQFCGIGGGSTVTYIDSDAKILVDTGYEHEGNLGEENRKKNRKLLVAALKECGIEPSDIDIVFITHFHLDYLMNYRVFPDAEIVMSQQAVEKFNVEFHGVHDQDHLASGVQVILTPGHTMEHASLLLRTDPLVQTTRSDSGGRITGIGKVSIAVAGDAVISPSYYITGTLWKNNIDFYSEEAAKESVRKLSAVADFIISGHGGILTSKKS